MRPIVTDRVAWSVCLSQSWALQVAELIKMPFALWPIVKYSEYLFYFIWTSAAKGTSHLHAVKSVTMNIYRPCAAVMRPFVKLAWRLVNFWSLATSLVVQAEQMVVPRQYLWTKWLTYLTRSFTLTLFEVKVVGHSPWSPEEIVAKMVSAISSEVDLVFTAVSQAFTACIWSYCVTEAFSA